MVLRSDEEANISEVERDQRFRGNVSKGVATAATLTGAGVSSGIASKVLPFLNKYVPIDLAIKGINKVSPRLGTFLKKGQQMGLDAQEGLNFIKEKLEGDQPEKNPKENRNIIEKYSPELMQFMKEKIGGGEIPLRAAALAILDKGKNFESIIRKMEKENKTPWTSIVESVFGEQGGNKTPNQPQESQNPQQQQAGQGQQALMAILDKINQRLGQ